MAEGTPDSPYVTWDPKDFANELSLLLSVSTLKVYRDGEMIYIQGESSRCFYFVRSGRVKVSILKEDGSEKILAIQEKNTFFGESAAFDRHPYFATATAIEDAFLIIRRIIRKLRLLGFQVEDSAFLDAQRRIAHILVKLLAEVGEPGPDGTVIERGITHEDLANITGLSRVRVTTILNNLERAGIITKRRMALTVIDQGKLQSLLAGDLDEDLEK
jgi:CRP/FNR family cyclic AMP-dependent transcriptional regulator